MGLLSALKAEFQVYEKRNGKENVGRLRRLMVLTCITNAMNLTGLMMNRNQREKSFKSKVIKFLKY